MKKVVIISGSPTENGNTDLLCRAFAEGAREAGNEVETICLREKDIHYCRGCEACVKTGGGCVQKDDMAELIQKVHAADVFVLATPIYFMSVSAQLKTFIDRFIAGEDYMRNARGKKAYLLTVSAAPGDYPGNAAGADESYLGFLRCLRNVENGGILHAGDCYSHGSIRETNWPEKARALGKSV